MYNLVPTSDYTTPDADFSDAASTFVTGWMENPPYGINTQYMQINARFQ